MNSPTRCGTRSMCHHRLCDGCHRLVVPQTRESRLFITEYCPDCGIVISDVAKPRVLSACVVGK